MTDKAKFKALSTTNQNFRYSQTSSNSTENSDLDYYLYTYSQGYRNLEKGYWRGVLRAKNVDYDLRYNKEWNRRIELEDDDSERTNYSNGKSSIQIPGTGKFSKEYLTFINDNEIGWDTDRFKNFQKYQHQVGMKKQKNKEWLLSNGVKRTPFNAEIRTQNFKQFEANEKLKKDKKGSYLDKNKPGIDVYEYEKEDKNSYGTGGKYEPKYSSLQGSNSKKPYGSISPINEYKEFKFGQKPYGYDNVGIDKDKSRPGQIKYDKYGKPIKTDQNDRTMDKYKRTASYDNKKGEPRKEYGYDNLGKKQFLTDKKPGYGRNDKTRLPTDQFTYDSSVKGTKPQKLFQPTDYTKSQKQLQPSGYDRSPYDQTRPGQGKPAPGYGKSPYGGKSQLQQRIDKTSFESPYQAPYQGAQTVPGIKSTYDRTKSQQKLQGSKYDKYKPDSQGQTLKTDSQTLQSLYDKDKKKVFSNTEKKPRTDKNRLGDIGQKPSYVKRFDFDEKDGKYPQTGVGKQKDRYIPQQISEEDIYEYNPSSKKDFKPSTSSHYKQDQRRTPSTEGYPRGDGKGKGLYGNNNLKSYGHLPANSLDLSKYSKGGKPAYSKYGSTYDNKRQTGTPSSHSYQKDRQYPYGDDINKVGGTRNKSIQNAKFSSFGPGKYGMAYFKLKFLTTKEVCEKFWNSIDSGELPKSMFDSNRFSASDSKLSK